MFFYFLQTKFHCSQHHPHAPHNLIASYLFLFSYSHWAICNRSMCCFNIIYLPCNALFRFFGNMWLFKLPRFNFYALSLSISRVLKCRAAYLTPGSAATIFLLSFAKSCIDTDLRLSIVLASSLRLKALLISLSYH